MVELENTTNDLFIYFIVEFEWPEVITPEMAKASAELHRVAVETEWISEILAGYGGVGIGPSCIWVFGVKDYKYLNEVLNPQLTENPTEIAKVYSTFFNQMIDVQTRVRHQVKFI